jgi:hypothetical protein
MNQHEKVWTMLVRGGEGKWWNPEEFISWGGLYIGYKAPTRISELATEYSQVIERRKSLKGNRQHQYRFKFEKYNLMRMILPEEYRVLLDSEMEMQKVGSQRLL